MNVGSEHCIHPSCTAFLGDRKGGFGLLPLMDLGVWGLFYGHAGGSMSMGWAEGTNGPQTGTVMGKCTRTDDIDLHDAV